MKVVYEESLLGQKVWYRARRVKVVELARAPTCGTAYVSDAKLGSSLGVAPLESLKTCQALEDLNVPADLDTMVGKCYVWGGVPVRIDGIRTRPFLGSVLVSSKNEKYLKELNVSKLSFDRPSGRAAIMERVQKIETKIAKLKHERQELIGDYMESCT